MADAERERLADQGAGWRRWGAVRRRAGSGPVIPPELATLGGAVLPTVGEVRLRLLEAYGS